jgi:two-component system sensor histidine kinase UhpB
LALYRVAQEALTNVQRHARAQEVWFQLTQQDGKVTLLVSDNGTGPRVESPKEGGFGLRGLRERAARLGGELYLDPRPGGGSQLRFSLPLPCEEAND